MLKATLLWKDKDDSQDMSNTFKSLIKEPIRYSLEFVENHLNSFLGFIKLNIVKNSNILQNQVIFYF